MRPLHVQAICANYLHKLLDDCCRRYKMLPKPSVCKRHIAWLIVLQITTAGTTTRCQLRVITEVCLCKQAKHSDGASINWVLAQKKYETCFWFHANSYLKQATSTFNFDLLYFYSMPRTSLLSGNDESYPKRNHIKLLCEDKKTY